MGYASGACQRDPAGVDIAFMPRWLCACFQGSAEHGKSSGGNVRTGKRALIVALLLALFLPAAFAVSAGIRGRNDGTDRGSRAAATAQSDLQRTERAHDGVAAHAVSRRASPELQERAHIYAADELEYYLTADEISFIRPGLNCTILDVTIPADRKPLVTFKLTDNLNQPLDRLGALTPGAVSTSFILAYLPPSTKGEVTDYVAYTTRTQTSPITGVKAVQAGADSGGSYAQVGDGTYTYKFNTALPSAYNTAATTTLGMYGRRDLREFGYSFYALNATKDFVPNGSAATQVHKVVLTANCNQCHDPLALHGETGRRAVEVCILCHNPGVIDPDTGNSVDMKVMTHKIHMGKTLPSVVAGTPYVIIGNAQSTNDYSEIGYPQDIRNCQTCHKGANQVNAWTLQPTIDGCGSCHDDVDFATGANHAAGPYADDSKCATCHKPTGSFEYDASITGAHTVPYKSTQLQFPKLDILSVTNTAPGKYPTITFQITDKNGAAMAPSLFGGTLGRFSANLAGPTTDYTTRISETISGATYAGGIGTYTFKTIKIPDTAAGTWALEFEGRLTATIVKGGDAKDAFTQRDAMDNVVKYFAVTGTTVTPRRTVVSLANCNKCHEKLQLHGGNRNQIEACVVCHNPTLTAGTLAAGTLDSVSMQVMIHKIHTGEELNNDYIVGGTNFKEVLYPGDRRNCAACHVNNSFQVPLPLTNVATVTPAPKYYWTPTQAVTAACISCHDAPYAAAHAFLNTADIGTVLVESCPACHKEGADWAVGERHAR